jgi:RNA polymerase-binding transcription factor DksA
MTTYPLEYFADLLTSERDHLAGMKDTWKLEAVERAIETLHTDPAHYGVCVACSRQIDPDRLRIVPATRYCEDDAELRTARTALQSA